MGRYLKGPFPLGSVLCTYERPLEIQHNTSAYLWNPGALAAVLTGLVVLAAMFPAL